ncbi:amino acid adenylation domain-containing protein [Brevibacillus borstelensis]|uniref:amino acid adenylation domain-containing protein n=1 Tax=Brevibacillus borstelensis TaxID=45462 RepID=UPI0030BA8306
MDKLKGLSMAEKRKMLEELMKKDSSQPKQRSSSYAQQRLWFIQQLDVNSSTYHMPFIWQLEGNLNVSALERSIHTIIQRHEALRTKFAAVDGKPVQVIVPMSSYALSVWSVEAFAPHEKEEKARQWIQEEIMAPFDLTEAPLFRALLIRLDEQRHWLAFNLHHIIFDGWSMGIFSRELTSLYKAYSSDAIPALSPPPIQYADFAVWQREWLRGEQLEKQLAYWKNQLKDVPVLALPTDRARPAVQTYRGRQEGFCLSEKLSKELKAFSHQAGTTLFMTMLAAYQLLLSRYAQQDDIAVGTPIANRNREEIENVIGFFVNTLVLRTKITPTSSFYELLEQVKQMTVEAYEHQDIPFEKLVAEVKPTRDTSYSPLFQVFFALQNAPEGSIELEELTVSSIDVEADVAIFDLSLSVWEENERIAGYWEYNTDLFEKATIQRMIGSFTALLEKILAHPEAPLSSMSLLSEDEQQQMVARWNQTEKAYPLAKCVHEWVEEQALQIPQAIAIVDGHRALTYGELNRRANQLAHLLRARGLAAGQMVGVYLERSLELIICQLAVFKAGGVYLPLDPSYPSERIKWILQDTDLPFLLTKEEMAATFSIEDSVRSVRFIWIDREEALLVQQPPTNLSVKVDAEQVAYVIYTSGSTGKPKGVMVPHKGLVNLVSWYHERYRVTPEDRGGQVARMGFDASMLEIWPILTAGAALYLLETETLLAPDALQQWIVEQEITLIHLPPVIAEEQIQRDWPDDVKLRVLLTGSDRLQTCPAKPLPFAYVNHYGPTEYSVICTSAEVPVQGEGAPAIGRPLSNTQVYVLDAHLQPVPVGVVGEIHVSGVGIAKGYLNRPELTAEKFINHPFLPGQKLYKTGDLGRFRVDGILEYVGRADDQVKLRGFRIELGEIESVLAQHPTVQAAVAMVREDDPGHKRLVAYVIPAENETIQVGEIRTYMQQRVPDYMIPSAFVVMQAFPLNSNEKIDRKALPAPSGEFQREKAYAAPRTELERTLAEIWQEVLQLPTVGVYDNFFELGGHSLLATQVVSRIRNILKVDIPLSAVFKFPVLKSLSEYLQAETGQSDKYAEVLPLTSREQDIFLSYAQQRLWFIQQIDLNSSTYHMPFIWQLDGSLNVTALEKSISVIIQRHEALRTKFAEVDGEPVQVIVPMSSYALSVRSVEALSLDEKEEKARQWIQEEIMAPFDLTEAPLFRALLIRLDEQRHWLAFNLHHIIFDGWSMGIFSRELTSLYKAYSSDAIPTLSPPPIQYADFAVWQREWLRGEQLEKQLAYWKNQLKDVPVLVLPTDRARPAVQTYRGRQEGFCLSEKLSKELKAFSHQAGTTLFMTMLAAYQLLLSRYAQQDDIAVGTPIANRNREEIENVIGFFVNTLVLRTKITPTSSFYELLQQVKQMTVEAYEHQDIPFEKLVAEVKPTRDTSYSPLFQVFFALQNAPEGSIELEELTISSIDVEVEAAKFDLTLSVWEENERIAGYWEYNTDLFEKATIQRMIRSFTALLEKILAHPEAPLSSMSLLSEDEQQMLVRWNQTERAYPLAKCVHEWVEEQALHIPQAVAVVDGSRALTYGELNRRANQLAHLLYERGLGSGQMVGVYLERSLELIICQLAVFKAGGVYLPLDPSYPSERIKWILQDAALSFLLTKEDMAAAFSDEDSARSVRFIWIDREDKLLAQQPSTNLPVKVDAEQVTYVIYTSGSTGKPKGVLVPHKGLVNLVSWYHERYQVTPEDRGGQVARMGFDASMLEIWPILAGGAALYLLETETLLSPDALQQWIVEQEITLIHLPPVIAEEQIQRAWPDDVKLRVLLTGSDRLQICPAKPLPFAYVNHYGPTECSVICTSAEVPVQGEGAPAIGRPLSNTQVYVLDAHLQPVPVGVVGEIHVSGVGIAKGYLNLPKLTAEKFIDHPFLPGQKLYKTGDLVRFRADGILEYAGRADDQVKLRGFRIELGEIESVLAQHPTVLAAVAVVREDEPGHKRLVAYVIPVWNEAIQVGEIRTYMQQRVPDYMIPSAFVVMQAFPLTSNEKIDRKALPAPSGDFQREKAYVAPRTELERTLAEIWQEVLQLPTVGVYDNFFELGGHSLLATQVVSRIRKKASVDVAINTMFSSPTIAALAEELGTLTTKADRKPAIQRISRQGNTVTLDEITEKRS